MSRNIWLVVIHIHQESVCNTPLRKLLEGREVALDTHCSTDPQREMKEARGEPGVPCCVSQTLHSYPAAKASTAKLEKGKEYGCREKKS